MDTRLVERARNKDEQAYAELIDLTSKKMYFTACDFVHDEDEAKNIVQDVYRNCFEKMYQLKDDSKFESWIMVSLTNKCRDYLRKNHKYDEVYTGDLNEDELDFESNIEDERTEFKPDANFNYQELKEGLQGVLAELPDIQRMSIILVHLDGLKVKEAAAALQVPEGTVKSSISIGKQKIKNKIEELRKQNKSFYAVAPIPFLVWMLKEEMEKTSVPTFVVHASTIEPIKVKPSTSATTKVASAATKASAGKVIAKVAVAAVVGTGAVFGGYKAIGSMTGSNEEKTVEKDSEEKDTNKVVDDTSVYDEILASRKAYLNGESNSIENGEFDHDLMDIYSIGLDYGYTYRDLNGDGISELILGPGSYGGIHAIFTQKDGKPVKCRVLNADIFAEVGLRDELNSETRFFEIFLLSDNKIGLTSYNALDQYYVGHFDKDCDVVIDEYYQDGTSGGNNLEFLKWISSTNEKEEISESEFESFYNDFKDSQEMIDYKSLK